MIPPYLLRSLLALLLPALVASCQSNLSSQARDTSSQPQATKPLRVVATFLPMYWFAKAVAGDLARVEVLVPPGTEVHEYQATPKDVQAIAQANVLVKNGLGLEEFLEDTVKNAQNSQMQQIDASKGIQAIEDASPVVEVASSEKTGTQEHHEHEGGNPHVWLNPILAIKQVENIRDGLIAADPTNKTVYEANAATYIEQLKELDRQFDRRLQPYPNCTFVTFHNAYPYLADRYQLKQVAVVELPDDRLSPADIKKVITAVKQYKVKALFGEPGTDNKLLESLSRDLKLTLRPLDSLEYGSLDPQAYFTAMNANLQALESGCR